MQDTKQQKHSQEAIELAKKILEDSHFMVYELDNEWIKATGSQPVDGSTEVDVVFSDGETQAERRAERLDWNNDASFPIKYWRYAS